MADRRASSLLSLVALRALAQPSAEQQRHREREAKRQAEEQQMMYAVRMTYLAANEGGHGPDALFLTRKRAQKLASRQDSATMSSRRLDAQSQSQSQSQSQPQPRKSNPSNSVGAGAVGAGASSAAAGPTTKKGRGFVDDAAGRQLTWEPRFQAGCHFWQCVETGECKADPPPNARGQHRGQLRGRQGGGDSEEDDDPPFPESFAFLGKQSA